MAPRARPEPERCAMPDADDRQFFEERILEVMDRLYAAALRLTRESTEAEDLVAETVMRAWAKLDQLEDRERFQGWIFRILTNAFISTRRRSSRAEIAYEEPPETSTDEFSLFGQLHQPFLLWWSSPEQAFLNKVLREDIEEALDRLPEVFRTVVVLVDVQGFPYAEVAEFLQIPVGTVRSRLKRGRSRLQRHLWQHAQERGIVASQEVPGP
jgi:RNA polymerase sigma-70 factor (ECF subfamily)